MYYEKSLFTSRITDQTMNEAEFSSIFPEIGYIRVGDEINARRVTEIVHFKIFESAIYETYRSIDRDNIVVALEKIADFSLPPTAEETYQKLLVQTEQSRKVFKGIFAPDAKIVNPETFRLFDRETEMEQLNAYLARMKTGLAQMEAKLENARLAIK